MGTLRIVALWVFGLLASGIFGGVIGSQLPNDMTALHTGSLVSYAEFSRSRASACGSARFLVG